MVWELKYASGKVGIVNSEAAFMDPLDNLSDVAFHTDLTYIEGGTVTTGSINLPARGSGTAGKTTHNLFAHGKTGLPVVIGKVTFPDEGGTSRTVPFVGSVPMILNSRGWNRIIHLGVDGTNVLMHEQWLLGISGQAPISAPARTVNYEIMVTNYILPA